MVDVLSAGSEQIRFLLARKESPAYSETTELPAFLADLISRFMTVENAAALP